MANQTEATVEKPSTSAERPMDINTKLAFERTNRAHERTLMAWVAGLISVLGLLALGAVIFRL